MQKCKEDEIFVISLENFNKTYKRQRLLSVMDIFMSVSLPLPKNVTTDL